MISIEFYGHRMDPHAQDHTGVVLVGAVRHITEQNSLRGSQP